MTVSILELVDRARLLMRHEAERRHEDARMLTWWQHRAADALASEDEHEARELVQAAALLLPAHEDGGSPGVADWHRDVVEVSTAGRQRLAADFMRSAASLLEQSSALLWQQSVQSRLGDLCAELRSTASGIEAVDGQG